MQFMTGASAALFMILTPALAPTVLAAKGDLAASFNLDVAKFAVHPSDPVLYASIPSLGSVASIDTDTLTLRAQTYVGSDPYSMALSPDGSRLYVALQGPGEIKLLDTATMQVSATFVIGGRVDDLEYGLDDRLFVSGVFSGSKQINAFTGDPVGNFETMSSGFLEINMERTRLYNGTRGYSPSALREYDVSTLDPVLTYENPHGSLGSNGQDLGISHSGDFICYPCAAGNGGGYAIKKIETSTKATLGAFDTGPYPREICFSPDDSSAYAVHTSGHVDVFDVDTFLPLGPISTPGMEPIELEVDRSARYLFVASTAELRVYETGEAIIPVAHSVHPDRVRYGSQPLLATIQGESFNAGVSAIFFGQTEATNVQVVSDDIITCLAPTGNTGPVDVRMVGTYGESTLEAGFVYAPAHQVAGHLVPGGQLELKYWFDPGDYIVTLWGIPPTISRSVPGVDGTFCISNPFLLAVFDRLPADNLTVTLDIPDSAALIGFEALVQSLVAIDPQLDGAAFTNCVLFRIGDSGS